MAPILILLGRGGRGEGKGETGKRKRGEYLGNGETKKWKEKYLNTFGTFFSAFPLFFPPFSFIYHDERGCEKWKWKTSNSFEKRENFLVKCSF